MYKKLQFFLLALVVFSLLSAGLVRAEGGVSDDSATDDSRPRVVASNSAVLRVREREELQTEFKQKIAEVHMEIASKTAELKDRLKVIKDQRKQTTVENIDSRISTRNSDWVTHWNNVLTRLSAILDKIQTRADTASGNGKDVSSVTLAIASARAAIVTAQSAVNTQAGKTYTINITTEGNLGSAVSTTIATFHTDVATVIDSINLARKSVFTALQALGTVLGEPVSPAPSATPSV